MQSDKPFAGNFTLNTTYYTGEVYEWNLPTGWSCPFAQECLVKVNPETGKFQNKSTSYRCYAAAAERFPGVRDSRWENFNLVKQGHRPMLPPNARHIRIHASGDFFSQAYFDMWLEIARENPSVEFWAFTKSIPYWLARLDSIPANLVLTASVGSRHNALIFKPEFDFRTHTLTESASTTDAHPFPIGVVAALAHDKFEPGKSLFVKNGWNMIVDNHPIHKDTVLIRFERK